MCCGDQLNPPRKAAIRQLASASVSNGLALTPCGEHLVNQWEGTGGSAVIRWALGAGVTDRAQHFGDRNVGSLRFAISDENFSGWSLL